MSDRSVRWPTTALMLLGVLAPLNVKVTANSWTDLQFRILILFGLVVSVVLVIRSLTVPCLRLPDSVEWLAFAWLVAVWLSALLSDDPALGSAGAARLSVAILLIPATRSVVRCGDDARRVLSAVAAGTALGAAIGLGVWIWGNEVAATRIFVGEATKLGPLNRLTRPWAHANIAAAAFVVTIAAASTIRRRALLGAALGLMTVSLVLTISRGGLLAGLGVAAMWVVLRRRAQDTLIVGSLVGLAAVTFLLSSGWSTRVDQLGDQAFYAATVTPPAELTLDGSEATFDVVVTNNSITTWPHTGDSRVLLSARWFGSDGLIWVEDRFPLPIDVDPGQSITVSADFDTRVPTGDYRVRWDLVIPRAAYFQQFLGEDPAVSLGAVASSTVLAQDVVPYDLVPRTVRLTRTEIWRLAWQEFSANPLLGVGPNQFGSAAVALGLQPTARTPASHAHSIFLEPLATWGLAGSVPFFILAAGGLLRVMTGSWRTRELVPTVLAVGLGGLFLHGLVDWPLVVITTGIPIGLILGLAWSDAPVSSGANQR